MTVAPMRACWPGRFPPPYRFIRSTFVEKSRFPENKNGDVCDGGKVGFTPSRAASPVPMNAPPCPSFCLTGRDGSTPSLAASPCVMKELFAAAGAFAAAAAGTLFFSEVPCTDGTSPSSFPMFGNLISGSSFSVGSLFLMSSHLFNATKYRSPSHKIYAPS
ncbi:hypothetical protein SDC9_95217 [bioreactor metagenome]|uniref:Uncharacterized protein n=1 Tax=bioreactor metagenome TaxID=1076179 RepID=A0A645A5X9_9ZZZZ